MEAKFGIKRSTAKKLVRRDRNISPALWRVIREAKNAVPDGLLDKLAGFESDARNEVERLVINEGCSLTEAIKSLNKNRTKKIPSPEDVVRRLASTWGDWTVRQRAEFVRLLKSSGDEHE